MRCNSSFYLHDGHTGSVLFEAGGTRGRTWKVTGMPPLGAPRASPISAASSILREEIQAAMWLTTIMANVLRL